MSPGSDPSGAIESVGLTTPESISPSDGRSGGADQGALGRRQRRTTAPAGDAAEAVELDRGLEAASPDVPWADQPGERRVAMLELALGEWFHRRRRSRDVRVFVYPREDEVWFLVRHGEPFRRDERLEGRASVADASS